jgi:hypothetical protein
MLRRKLHCYDFLDITVYKKTLVDARKRSLWFAEGVTFSPACKCSELHQRIGAVLQF